MTPSLCPSSAHILILGGTQDGYRLASALVQRTVGDGALALRVTSSFAGRTESPKPPAGDYRLGGFGGVSGLVGYLRDARVTAVVDATHPFAATMGENAQAACHQTGIPLLRLARRPWTPAPGDRWISVGTWDQAITAAQRLARAEGRRTWLLAIGRNDLGAFADLADLAFVIRAVDSPRGSGADAIAFDRRYPEAKVITARGPFDDAEEQALFTQQGIEGVICKNAGGQAGIAKLRVARLYGLPVILRSPPPRNQAATVDVTVHASVHSVEEAVAWVLQTLRAE